MRLLVIKWLDHISAHQCKVLDGVFPGETSNDHLQYVDLYVGCWDGSLDGVDPMDLVGKTIDCAYVHPWCYIASETSFADRHDAILNEANHD